MRNGILIDVVNEEIKEVSLGNDYKEIYPFLNCERFDVVSIDNDNDVFVDDEGLLNLNAKSKFFLLEGAYPTPLAGNGLILGLDSNSGKSISTTLTADEIRSRVRFLNIYEAREFAEQYESR